jgi:hypothetical protein
MQEGSHHRHLERELAPEDGRLAEEEGDAVRAGGQLRHDATERPRVDSRKKKAADAARAGRQLGHDAAERPHVDSQKKAGDVAHAGEQLGHDAAECPRVDSRKKKVGDTARAGGGEQFGLQLTLLGSCGAIR